MSVQKIRLQAALNGEPTNGVIPKKLTDAEKAEKEQAQKELLEKFKLSSEALTKTDNLEINGRKNKDNRKVRLNALTEYFKTPAFGLTEKEAKEFAEYALKDEMAEERVEHTRLYFNKDDYKANKKKDKQEGFEAEYVGKKAIRKAILARPELFFEQNEDGSFKLDKNGQMIFSQAKYNNTILEHTGDYRMEIQERKGLAAELDISKRNAKNMAKIGNFDYEKDKTWLYRAAAILGAEGLSTVLGGILGKFTHTTVDSTSYAKTIDKETGELLEESLKTARVDKTNTKRFAAASAIGNLLPAIALSMFIKDRGKESIMNTTAENIVQNGAASVEGKDNKKLVGGLLELMDAAGLKEEQKIKLIEVMQGIASGKHTTERELAAGIVQIKELLIIQPETVKKDDNVDNVEEVTTPATTDSKVEYGKRLAPKTITTEKKEDIFKYPHQAGEYWAGIAKNMYGVDDLTGYKIGKELKKRHGYAPSSADMPKFVNLPKEIEIKGKTYTRKIDKEEDIVRTPDTQASNGKQRATSSFQPKVTTETSTVYDGYVSKIENPDTETPAVHEKQVVQNMPEETAKKWYESLVPDTIKKFFE